MKTQAQKLLIANRGEIAIRIAHAARDLGIPTVAVFAAEDSLALHSRMAEEAIALPAASDPVSAYLNIEALLEIATEHNCTMVHPGYGFLSENAQFAAACAEAGIEFVGPAAATLELFGNKVAARNLASSLDIPVIAGSSALLKSAVEASALAREFGYPVMLKAAAGGGGRGMRVVHSEDELATAFQRCQGEAQAAFGNGDLFIEKLLIHPRHIEVQVLADKQGNTVHLFDRDCSIQQRHQKVIEIAPAPALDETVRDKLLNDAVRLARAAEFQNAGTVEFLVTPEGDHYFIECNPRIQVEHTITEQVLGIDLVEAQLQIGLGRSLSELGMGSQSALPNPRGFAIQTRVVASGTGTITAYKEPSGPGVRVDGCGYTGLTPPPQFDPLLAKVICHHANSDLGACIARARHALEDFHIAGLSTNLSQLIHTLQRPEIETAEFHTTWLESLAPAPPAETANATLSLLSQQAKTLQAGARATPAITGSSPGLTVPEGQHPVQAPMSGNVIEVSVSVGDTVSPGDSVMIISAMKMETAITASTSGVVTSLGELGPGDTVDTNQVVALILPDGRKSAPSERAIRDKADSWLPTLDDVATLQQLAQARLAPGSDDPGVVRQRSRGKLTCRERIDLLLDPESFREVGSVAGFASYDESGTIDAFTPANHVGGWGTVDGRTTIVCADDFTSRGGHADGAIGAKSMYLDRLSMELRAPSVRMLDGSSGGGSVAAMVPQQKKSGESGAQESSGAIKAGRPRVAGGGGSFLPGHLGSAQYTEQLNTVPVVNMLLGSVVGIGAAKAVLGHFSVMVRDIAQLFVAGPPVVSHAMGYDISKEDLGGWHIHCTNGSVDNLAATEADAVAMAKRFLSYMPASVYDIAEVQACTDPIERSEEELLTIIPRKRTTTFDIRRVIELLADKDSFFEIGRLWGTDQVTGFVRFNGHPLGVIASDSRHENGGALTANGCDKLRRHLDLCDTFHIPMLNLIDNPGFAVGIEHEIAGTIRKGGEWMVAFAQIKIPIFSVLLRRSFGVAGNNYATPLNRPAVRICWPAADVGGIPPEGGIEAAYKRQLAEAADPVALRAELNARIESARGPVGPLNKFQLEEMVDPRATRRLICEWVSTAYRVAGSPDRLGPRPLQFRP